MTLEERYIRVNDVNIHYASAEPTNTLAESVQTIVFLHGFPECWQTWKSQLDYFGEHYRVIAPDLPGYHLSDKPADISFYQVSNLVTFFADFLQLISPDKKVFLVAHDWGGAIAWPLAAFYPQCIEKLIILNAAHPSTFTREMIENPIQREKSDYIHDLVSMNAEELLSQNDYAYLSEKMMVSADPEVFTLDIKKQYRQVWQQPGAVSGMLQYYRAMPQLATSKKRQTTELGLAQTGLIKKASEMRIPNIRIAVPTLILWGEKDQAFVIENLKGIEQYVANCTIKRFPNASHWLQHEQSPEINTAISEFIKC